MRQDKNDCHHIVENKMDNSSQYLWDIPLKTDWEVQEKIQKPNQKKWKIIRETKETLNQQFTIV